MKKKWSKYLLWSSLGSLAVGAAVAVARHTRRPAARPLCLQRIPPACRRLTILTEHFMTAVGEESVPAQDTYVLQATPFRVYSVLQPAEISGEAGAPGHPIYFVELHREARAGVEGNPVLETGSPRERFYGTAGLSDDAGKQSARNCLARGGFLEIRVCSVGGFPQGVETGEIHRSSAPVLNYRFDFSESAAAIS